jgi:site-specific recombinase XerD
LGISIQPAQPKKPTDKPTVERFFKTLREGLIQYLPAYKGPDVHSRGEDVESAAFLYLHELEDVIREWVALVYHCSKHDGLTVPEWPHLDLSPNDMFDIGVARAGLLRIPASPELAYDFLDTVARTIQHYGVEVNGLRYNGPGLDPYRNARSPYGGALAGKWPLRVNPDDVRHVWFQDPDDYVFRIRSPCCCWSSCSLGCVVEEWALFRVGGAAGAMGVVTAPELASWRDLNERESRLALRNRQPILLDPNLRSDARLSEFFRRSAFATRAEGTQESYVLDYRLFFTFLWRQGRNWDQARPEDLENYEYWRRRDSDNPRRIGGAKWGRELAALRLLYEWAARRGYVSGSPVVLRSVRLPDGGTAQVPQLAPTNVRASNVKWLTQRAYRMWRDVGLRGYDAAGAPDSGWRGRNDGRDAAFTDFVLSCGLRRREAATLLTVELPDTTVEQRYYPGRVAAAVAKRGNRYFYVDRAALKAVEAYRMTTRAEAVRRAQQAGTYQALPVRWNVQGTSRRETVRWVDQDGVRGEAPLNALTAAERLNLYVEGEDDVQPLAVWLTEAGLPMRYRSWNKVFGQANTRCESLGLHLFCSPHMLRHSFALTMLISLHHALDRRLGLSPAERRYYEQVYGNVWTLLKDLLGHSSVEVTRNIYLEPVRGLQLDTLLNDVEDETADDLLTRLAAQTGLILDVARQATA